jgi:hypothetical protein
MAKLLPAILRSASLTVTLAIVVLGGLYYVASQREARLREQLAQVEATMRQEIAAREAMLARLSRSHRKGRLEVIGQTMGDQGYPSQRDGQRVLSTTVRFIELDDDGRELGRREVTVPGDTIFVDAWTARFPKSVVAEGNPLRDRTLVLLRRIYSDRMPPIEGHPIDTPGAVPDGYAGSERLRLEQAVWKGFWKLAADPDLARLNGIAVAQGEAVYKPMRIGESYDLFFDAAGGLTLTPTALTAQADGNR